MEEELKAAKTASDDGDSNFARGQMQHLICPVNVSHTIQTGGNEENSQPRLPNPRITDESHSTLGEDEIPVTRPVTEDVHYLLPSQGLVLPRGETPASSDFVGRQGGWRVWTEHHTPE